MSTALASFSQIKSHVFTEGVLNSKGYYSGHSAQVNVAGEMGEQPRGGSRPTYETYRSRSDFQEKRGSHLSSERTRIIKMFPIFARDA